MNAHAAILERPATKDQTVAALTTECASLKHEVAALKGALQAATAQLITARRMYLDEAFRARQS